MTNIFLLERLSYLPYLLVYMIYTFPQTFIAKNPSAYGIIWSNIWKHTCFQEVTEYTGIAIHLVIAIRLWNIEIVVSKISEEIQLYMP